MKVEGLQQVFDFFDKYARDAEAITDEELEIGGDLILEASNRLAPVETGTMRRETDVVKKEKLEYQVRYNTDYSLYVHEDLEKVHPTGQAKFLEKATNENGKKVIKNIADGIGSIKR